MKTGKSRLNLQRIILSIHTFFFKLSEKSVMLTRKKSKYTVNKNHLKKETKGQYN